jgi:hypothetical protein
MKYRILLYLFSICVQPLMAQSDTAEIKTLLTNNTQRRWVFEKLEKSLGQKSHIAEGCEYSLLTFSFDSNKYFGVPCVSNTNKKGQYKIIKLGLEEFTIELDKKYEIAFYKKDFKGKIRQFMRLKIPGIGMDQVALEYHYYAE